MRVGIWIALIVLAAGITGGAATGWMLVRASFPLTGTPEPDKKVSPFAQAPLLQLMAGKKTDDAHKGATKKGLDASLNALAMQYALAVQNRDCEEVIRLTQWMNERLTQVKSESGDLAVYEAAKEALYKRITEWDIEENQLSQEGLDDSYIFAPGATFEIIGQDTVPQEDYEQPVGGRTWLRVTYPGKQRAPRDGNGQPINCMQVGVVVSTNGKILKAGIKGNIQINYNSVSTQWEPSEGG